MEIISETYRVPFLQLQRVALDAAPASVAIINSAGIIVMVNRCWREFACSNGYRDPEAGIGESYLQICDNASADGAEGALQVRNGIAAVLRGEQNCFSHQYPCHSLDMQRWFRLVVFPVAIEGFRGAILVHIDITEFVATETQLRNSAATFRQMVDVAPVMVWVTDADKLCVDCSQGWLDFTGRTIEQELGLGWVEGIHPDDLGVMEIFSQAFDRREPFTVEYRLRRHDGVYRWLLDNGAPRFGPDGTFLGYVGSGLDITERKQGEEVLRQAKRIAEQANAAKTRFLAAASHDLRQPLQAQVLFHDVLSRRNRDPHLAPIIAKMRQSLEAQQQMLTALLDISRLEAGIVDVTRIDFPVGPFLDHLVHEFAAQAEQHGLELRTARCSAIVHSDPALLERILRNLLTNAIKYTNRGRILLGCRRSGSRLRIQVYDTGRGIPESHLNAIFEEFRQLSNPARNRGLGLGLGLAIVDRLAKLLGHRVGVRSVEGKGSMFEVEVPLVRTMPVSPPPRLAAAPAATNGGGLVVVIDDHAQLLEALKITLELIGYEVLAAENLGSAVAALRTRQRAPSVILADYRLEHGATGSEAIRRLRSEFGETIPGILLTGDTSPDRLKEAKASGFHLLHKPVKAEILNETIERLQRAG